jgi:hypothetical protein
MSLQSIFGNPKLKKGDSANNARNIHEHRTLADSLVPAEYLLHWGSAMTSVGILLRYFRHPELRSLCADHGRLQCLVWAKSKAAYPNRDLNVTNLVIRSIEQHPNS